ncbi:MAG TPA: tyrosine--tRNA ligase [Alphaproteobacteria bacterium]
MASFKSDFLRVLSERGYIHQGTDLDGLDAAATAGRVTAYVGYDCTANSLHIGNLISIMMLRWLQKTGHQPIALMGGGTTKIGDPSGKDETRQLLGEAEIAANMASIKRSFANFLSFGSAPTDAIVANNADWLDELKYIPLLRDVGRHFSVNRMLTMDSVRLRLERDQPLSFLEFNYMILQAYDFVELAKRHGCVLQMGGSDQWGNIVMGVELGRRVADLSLFGLTTPLMTTASGAKMGKTAQGAIWLNPDRLSPYDYWQFWRNTEDADVGRFLRLYTELALDEIARLEKLDGAEINEAKKILATEATKLCHGEAAAREAAATAQRTFEQGAAGEGLPSIEVARAELDKRPAVYALLHRAGLVSSNAEARRLMQQGGARVNDVVVTDQAATVGPADLTANGYIKLSAGRKRHALVRAV